ncbi:unnamed protein product [Meloidogyne enterolobii]|uniref:Uncharacterized protein n=1 Tax=Meloidogyne enterolobii TaxID=390850 RepID=A0ACB0Z7V5_MELEN
MESIQVQKKILEQMSFSIDGHIIELRVPCNRIFISRVPDETRPSELVQFVETEIKKFEPRGYCVDAYFPHPFCQFAFCTVGGAKVSARLAIKADFFFKGSSVGISTCCDGSELDADRLLEQKIKDLVDQNDYARIRSLQSISTEDNVFEMCKKVALETNKENDQSTNRKRIRLDNDREKERTEELSDLSIVEEDVGRKINVFLFK